MHFYGPKGQKTTRSQWIGSFHPGAETLCSVLKNFLGLSGKSLHCNNKGNVVSICCKYYDHPTLLLGVVEILLFPAVAGFGFGWTTRVGFNAKI